MYKIRLIEYASEDIIKKAIEMDHAAFPASDWITKEDAELIYSNKKDCLIWLTQDEEPVGFATVFSLNETLPAEAMEKNKPVYKLLTQAALKDADTGILYCHCFLLLPQYRTKGLVYHLYEGLKEWLNQKGRDYSSIYADAVSAEGVRCLERIGFKPVYSFGDGGTLYKADKKCVINAITK